MPKDIVEIEIEITAKVRWWVRPLVWFIQRVANLIANHGVKARVK